ncbi:MAG: hypothetical protein HGA49_09845 [Eubacteriaceae bacterium]|nr:hypothetical protein [Eubacteriaceae bacterium]
MTGILGTAFLIVFILTIIWLFIKFNIDTNHNITKSLKRIGFQGDYYQYKRSKKRR